MNNILFAVLSNIHENELALTKISIAAFGRAAPYIRRNFEVEEQCDYIMKAIFSAA